MFEHFYPDEIRSSAYSINYEKLYQQGYRGLIFDIDNTLVEHDADADERAVGLFKRLRKLGFSFTLLSNNDRERVERFNREIGAHMVVKAGKPMAKGYNEAMRRMGTDHKNTIFIGDQIFTDIWGAKRLGIRNILVRPIAKHEEIQIVLKRYLERIVLWEYNKKVRIKLNKSEN